ncbi:MAG TPA: sensor histidine kinase [Candidatus Eisenbacteria bacterium]|jgi:two-component sensor histidine kinase
METKTPSPRMHPALRGLLDLAWQQPLWAVPFALFFGTIFGARPADYWLCYKLSLVFTYGIGLWLWFAKQFIHPRIQRQEAADGREHNMLYGVWIAGGCLVASYVTAFVVHRTFLPGFLGSPRQAAISGMYTAVFATLFGGIQYARLFYRRAVDRAAAVERMRAELAQAELRALRAQINPHFLFNTLNSIAALIADDPRAAEDTTTSLAEVFRYALAASGNEHARLGDELAFLRTYLDIERTRFSERLRYEEAIEPGLESALVPSLLLQPLVENAIRHGVSPRPAGGTVRIAARREGDRLVVEVSDDGAGMDPAHAPSGAGFGLHAVRERLRVAGRPHDLEIESAPGRGTRVRVTLPLHPAGPAAAPTAAPSGGTC